MDVYCYNKKCEYNEDDDCVCESSLKLDENGTCLNFRYKTEED